MSYQKVHLDKFGGINTSVGSQDHEARLIVNLRMERVGRLVTRNGVEFAVFASQASRSAKGANGTGDFIEAGTARAAMLPTEIHEVHGIASVTFEKKWEAINSERATVYACSDATKDFLIVVGTDVGATDVVYIDKVAEKPQVDKMTATIRKTDILTSREKPTQDGIDFEQYRHQLFIADIKNGDSRIVNRWDTTVPIGARNPRISHEANCLPMFDTGAVAITYPAIGAKKNWGMGLYRYQLPEKDTMVSPKESFAKAAVDLALAINQNPPVKTFTNSSTVRQYRDILSRVQAFTDNTKEEVPDVYVWNDVKIDYERCSGATEGMTYLTGNDRTFKKLLVNVPRITTLTPKQGRGADVPLGVWRYRFVWDFGDGSYSAPSEAIEVLDTQWSAMSDSAVTVQTYQRPLANDKQSSFFVEPKKNPTSGTYQTLYEKVLSALYAPAHKAHPSNSEWDNNVYITLQGLRQYAVADSPSPDYGGAYSLNVANEDFPKKYSHSPTLLGEAFYYRLVIPSINEGVWTADAYTSTTLRAPLFDNDRLWFVDTKVPVPASDRLIAKGEGAFDFYAYIPDNDVTAVNAPILRLYVQGERLLIQEQLSAVFPASLLFNAPMSQITVPSAAVPQGAKRMIVYRTMCSHHNNYDPMRFGFAAEVEITRNATTGVAETLSWQDEIKDGSLNFSRSPEEMEGIVVPLRSRFNLAIAERLLCFNFYEKYYMPNPPSTTQAVAFTTGGFLTGTATYNLIYKDILGNVSGSTSASTAVTGSTGVVALYGVPMPYTARYASVDVYRRAGTETKFRYVGSIKSNDEAVFVDDKPLALTTPELPVSNIGYELYESGVRISEPYQPSVFKEESFLELASGDGDEITGTARLYGNAIVFKNNSMHRLTLQGDGTGVSRIDQISGTIGCIAPDTVIEVDNTLYFLSTKGFFMYDNNVMQRIDGLVANEIELILRQGDYSMIQRSSCGYNAPNNELYLNIPTGVDGAGNCVYVFNLQKQYCTKFVYGSDYGSTALRSSSMQRRYHTRHDGDLLSADAKRVVAGETPTPLYAGLYNESSRSTAKDDTPHTAYLNKEVEARWQSKVFNGGDTTVMKRLRNVMMKIKGTKDVTLRISSTRLGNATTTGIFPAANVTASSVLEYVPPLLSGSDSIFKSDSFQFEISSTDRVEVESFSFAWRPIDPFLS
jgi:hypothetical protein